MRWFLIGVLTTVAVLNVLLLTWAGFVTADLSGIHDVQDLHTNAIYKLYDERGWREEGIKALVGGGTRPVQASGQVTGFLAGPEGWGPNQLWECHQTDWTTGRRRYMDCRRVRQSRGKTYVWRCFLALGREGVEDGVYQSEEEES